MPHVLTFDSGIGGFGIVAALRDTIADASISMLADNAFYPYGEAEDAVLIARIERVIEAAIARLAPDIVVIACNTASTAALAALRARFAVPFIGCVPPIKWAASLSRSRTIGVLATAATVRGAYLGDLARRHAPDCRLITYGARGLADLAEAAFRGLPVDRLAIGRELDGLFSQPHASQLDTVCIGCTHYSFLLDHFRDLSPAGLRWLDPAQAVAARTQSVLAGLPPSPAGKHGSAYFTAPPADAASLAAKLPSFGFSGFSLVTI